MLSKGNQPNAAQRQWLKDIAEYHQESGVQYLYGDGYGHHDYQLHHVVGRSYKQDKIPVGNWFALPVPICLHDVHSNHPDNVTHFRRRFTARFGTQRELFKSMVNRMAGAGYCVPDKEVMQAIMATRY